MNFKKPKQQVLDEAQMRAEDRIRGVLRNTLFQGASMDPNSTINLLTFAISQGIAEALKSMMENVYTDQEFEEDIGLRDKL
jgi:hypothetical protein